MTTIMTGEKIYISNTHAFITQMTTTPEKDLRESDITNASLPNHASVITIILSIPF